jgi:hypothetical protein
MEGMGGIVREERGRRNRRIVEAGGVKNEE